jgi:hypothetical protein
MDSEKREWNSRPWKWTDDILGSAIVIGYMTQNVFGLVVPDWAFAASLLWLFGSRVADLLVSLRR